MVLNKNDRYYRLKISLKGERADLMVEAGLDRAIDYEAPSLSISLLDIPPDHSTPQVWLYTSKMAGKATPEFKPLRE